MIEIDFEYKPHSERIDRLINDTAQAFECELPMIRAVLSVDSGMRFLQYNFATEKDCRSFLMMVLSLLVFRGVQEFHVTCVPALTTAAELEYRDNKETGE